MSLKSDQERAADELIGASSKPSTRQLIGLQRAAERRAMERLRAIEDSQILLIERLPGIQRDTIRNLRLALAAQDLDRLLDEDDEGESA